MFFLIFKLNINLESYIAISKLNDFVFCPRSIYLHSIYEQFDQKLYHRTPQYIGKIKHENIENSTYTTAKKYWQGASVASEKYNLSGKIDIYDSEKKELIERKYKIKKIFDGHRYQLYGQYFALKEMGYEVNKMFIHSLSDNKRYDVKIPEDVDIKEFEDVLSQIQSQSVQNCRILSNKEKCANCIYKELCH